MNTMPTEANKKAAVKAKVKLTKIVNGKRVQKTREELLKNIENKNKKGVPVANQPKKMSLREKRYRAFLNLYKYKNYPYIGDDLSQYAENYAGNKTAKLENYKVILTKAENEARRNYN